MTNGTRRSAGTVNSSPLDGARADANARYGRGVDRILQEPVSPNSFQVMKKTSARYLIHGIVETGEVRRSDCSEVLATQVAILREVLERSVSLPQGGRTEPLGGDWSIVIQASLPGGRLAVRLYAPGMDPAGACASSMSVLYDPGKPPVLWASRASVHLAPDPWKAASEVRDMELGLAWAWIPLVEAWIEEDWARTLDVGEVALEQEHPRELAGSEGTSVEEEECCEHEEAGIDEERETDEWELEGWHGDSPWEWAPVDVREDWDGPGSGSDHTD